MTNHKQNIFHWNTTNLNTSWSFSSRRITISPGSKSGSWSPSPLKTIFWPSIIPGSTWTSSIFLSLIVFLPLQYLQRSRGLIRSPCPLQSEHIVCKCCNIPGPNCWICTCNPEPWHVEHCSTEPFFPPTPNWETIEIIFFADTQIYTLLESQSPYNCYLHIFRR